MLGWAHSGVHKPDYRRLVRAVSRPQSRQTDKVAAAAYEDRHIFFAYVLLALIVIYVVAASWRHIGRSDPRSGAVMMAGAPG